MHRRPNAVAEGLIDLMEPFRRRDDGFRLGIVRLLEKMRAMERQGKIRVHWK